MFDLGWTEMLVIGVVALIVVGPKDLPVLFRQLGRMTGRARAMAREFTSAMNDAADHAGVSDVQKTLRSVKDPKTYGIDTSVLDAPDMGPETSKLSDERAEAKRRIEETYAEKAAARAAEIDGDAAELEAELTDKEAPKQA